MRWVNAFSRGDQRFGELAHVQEARDAPRRDHAAHRALRRVRFGHFTAGRREGRDSLHGVPVGSDVFISGTGSYNLAGATDIGDGTQHGFINSSLGLAVGGPFSLVDGYVLTVNPGAFGTGMFVEGSFSAASSPCRLATPAARWSGRQPSAVKSYGSLGLTPGTFVYALPNDTLTVNVLPVPEPASLILFGAGARVMLWRRRR